MKTYTKPTIEVVEIRASEGIAAPVPGYEGWDDAPVTRYDLLMGASSAEIVSNQQA